MHIYILAVSYHHYGTLFCTIIMELSSHIYPTCDSLAYLNLSVKLTCSPLTTVDCNLVYCQCLYDTMVLYKSVYSYSYYYYYHNYYYSAAMHDTI